ncbi:cation:proton antiporter [Fulvivirga kasyanovii]|uniref:Cation:proton antiporter n=1 Tax=Fulvivirga kasyanovii TaxID=396812 RepID=A0ABW9RYY7_9BACT|nr:cation:proton antiporter [Fulvivirga kasyanovii]MTI28504.1 cation:proton antiporter [Fulvivirga kasyanovii]
MGVFDHLLQEFELPLTGAVPIFSLILFIILLSPILLKKIKVPGIIGLIISGVIIGPNGLNILEQNSAVNLFSTIGLLYIMFIAGIELDIYEFKRNKYKSLGFGFFTFIIPLSLGIPVCHYLLGYNWTASLLIASMFATHTLVSYPIVAKFGISRNQAVAVTVGGTILTDTAVLILLAVIIGSVEGGLNPQFWLNLIISLAIFLSIIFFIIPKIAKWFFLHLGEDKTSHYVLILSLVFLSAFLAEISGVEPIIGAFMAGLALNRLIPHSSTLMNRLEFVGNAIFIPFFLISVGMLVDLKILFQGSTAIIVAVTLSIVALVGKYGAALVTQKIYKYSASQRKLIFGLSSAHAAATLAVILVGYRANIIDENILNGTVILILITCVVASFATESASKKIFHEQRIMKSEETEPLVHEENIIIPIANFDNLETLVDLVVLLKSKQRPSVMHILSVVKYDDEAEKNMQKIKRDLNYFVRYAAASETNLKTVVTFDVNSANGIIRISREIMADIFVMGWPKTRTFLSRVFNHTIESIINSTDKTILFCNIHGTLNTTRQIKVLCPTQSELEPGFQQWLTKVRLLSSELRAKLLFFCNGQTQAAINGLIKKKSPPVSYSSFVDMKDFLVLSKDINADDLFIVISSREGGVSYQPELKHVPKKLNKYFTDLNLILIYPATKSDEADRVQEYKSPNVSSENHEQMETMEQT